MKIPATMHAPHFGSDDRGAALFFRAEFGIARFGPVDVRVPDAEVDEFLAEAGVSVGELPKLDGRKVWFDLDDEGRPTFAAPMMF